MKFELGSGEEPLRTQSGEGDRPATRNVTRNSRLV